tara:strand:- start:227 stop:427 length:201 start_codon:yes stop_codon:yes gene_type:complete
MKNLIHKFIRWALGIHGAIHIVETALNLYESAYISAFFSLLSGSLMVAGSLLDSSHHKDSQSSEDK